jgi:hypothetical protein
MASAHTDPIRIRATKAKSSWIRYFVVGWLVNGTSGSAEDGISKWPSVVAVNRAGKERRILKLDSNEEAEAQAERVQADLEILGLTQWCEKYDVPSGFVSAE